MTSSQNIVPYSPPCLQDDWHNCYDLSWKKIATDAAFAHPAKFSHGLIRKIYQHCLAEGWLKPGDVVLDPFGGVALGGLYAAKAGLHWIGVELEQNFVRLANGFDCPGFDRTTWRRYHGRAARASKGKNDWILCPDCAAKIDQVPEDRRFPPPVGPHRWQGNIDLWNERFRPHFPGWGSVTLLQGDSRRLADWLREAGAVMKSPPYTNNIELGGNTGEGPGAAGNAVRRSRIKAGSKTEHAARTIGIGYGQTPGNIANLPEGQAIVSSPPYVGPLQSESNGIDWTKATKDYPGQQMHKARIANMQWHHNERRYSDNQDNLGNLPEGQPPEAIISSPPFAGNSGGRGEASRNGIDPALFDRHSGGMKRGTGDDPANLDHLPEGDVAAVVGSPPYAKQQTGGTNIWDEMESYHGRKFTDLSGRKSGYQDQGETEGQLAQMPEGIISSPPFADSVGSDDPDKRGGLYRDPRRRNDRNLSGSYGQTEGQLGAMAEGPAAMISSPPFEDFTASDNGFKPPHASSEYGRDESTSSVQQMISKDGYGSTPGQLGAMPKGCVSSPPYENSVNQSTGANDTNARIERMHQAGIDVTNRTNVGGQFGVARQNQAYGSTNGQIGVESGETFWSAARLIVQQCYDLLPAGGHAVWVVKDYIKGGQRVDFSGNWRRLCESVGFRTLHLHHAWLVKDNGTQLGMFGEDKDLRVERKSFFRRLAEKNGSPRIDYEIVLCMVKGGDQ